jgi:rod shape-determining protein MreC
MPLGTLDRTPPPFFRQGPSALTKLVFFSALALFLMASDARFELVRPLRAAIATVLHPIERTLLAPVEWWNGLWQYGRGLQDALEGEAQARASLARQAERTTRVDVLERENEQLRSLLGLRARLLVRAQAAEVLYEASDLYSRKVVIDRGATDGVALGSPVINEAGVLGQVTRVYPLSSELTLLTDKDAAIPVLNTRTQQRSAAYGLAGGGGLELRYMAGNADVQVGDLLSTSGVDGVYPPGVPVARVSSVERRAEGGFARIVLVPVAAPDGVRHVLVLEPAGLQLPRPPAEAASDEGSRAAKKKEKGRR